MLLRLTPVQHLLIFIICGLPISTPGIWGCPKVCLYTGSPQHAKDVYICRVPVFEERIDNIVGIAYAMDLLDFVQKVN